MNSNVEHSVIIKNNIVNIEVDKKTTQFNSLNTSELLILSARNKIKDNKMQSYIASSKEIHRNK